MEQSGQISFLIFLIVGGVIFNSLFGLVVSKIFESKGRSKGAGFWLGFFFNFLAVIIAIILPIENVSSSQSVLQTSKKINNNQAIYKEVSVDHKNEAQLHDDQDDSELRKQFGRWDREFEEAYAEKKQQEEDKADAYHMAQEQKKLEDEEYYEEKRQEENERLREEWDSELRRRAGYDED